MIENHMVLPFADCDAEDPPEVDPDVARDEQIDIIEALEDIAKGLDKTKWSKI